MSNHALSQLAFQLQVRYNVFTTQCYA